MTKSSKAEKKKGFAVLYSVLVIFIVLSVSLLIGDIMARQVAVSSTTKNYQYSYYVANALRECVRYYQRSGFFGMVETSDGHTFTYINNSATTTPDNLKCGNSVIIESNPAYEVEEDLGNGATTTFYAHDSAMTGINNCAKVEVFVGTAGGQPRFSLLSTGYNTACAKVSMGVFDPRTIAAVAESVR